MHLPFIALFSIQVMFCFFIQYEKILTKKTGIKIELLICIFQKWNVGIYVLKALTNFYLFFPWLFFFLFFYQSWYLLAFVINKRHDLFYFLAIDL